MRVPLLAGREFTEADKAGSPNVVMVNQALARRYWPNENPIGKHIIMGRLTPSEVVGVAADVSNRGLALDPQVQLYFPFSQVPWGNMNLLVRTASEPHGMISAIRAQVAAIDSDQPITNIQTVNELMDSSRADPRLFLSLLGALSAVALMLAIIGIYGVLAYSVAQRRQELGIRLALGAEKADIVRMVVGYGLKLAVIGIAIGLAVSLALSWTMASTLAGLLYKISARDLTTFVLAPVAFLVIALLASYLPARRATEVDPNEVLRGS